MSKFTYKQDDEVSFAWGEYQGVGRVVGVVLGMQSIPRFGDLYMVKVVSGEEKLMNYLTSPESDFPFDTVCLYEINLKKVST